MQRRQLLLTISVIAAFGIGRAVQAAGFLDSIKPAGGSTTTSSPSYSDSSGVVSSSTAGSDMTLEQQRYQQYMQTREARKQAITADFQRQYDTERAAALKAKSEEAAKSAADTVPQTSGPAAEDTVEPIKDAPLSSSAFENAPPIEEESNGALSKTYAPKALGYPYTSD